MEAALEEHVMAGAPAEASASDAWLNPVEVELVGLDSLADAAVECDAVSDREVAPNPPLGMQGPAQNRKRCDP
jgi:hypothetical protein